MNLKNKIKTITAAVTSAAVILVLSGCAAKKDYSQPAVAAVAASGSLDGSLKVNVLSDVITFAGNYNDVKKKFPYSSQVVKDYLKKEKTLTNIYSNTICKSEPSYFQIDSFTSGDQCYFNKIDVNKSFTPVISIMIDREHLSVLKVGKQYKVTAMISAQILAINVKNYSIVSTMPFYFFYDDLVSDYNKTKDKKYIKSLFDHVLSKEIPALISDNMKNFIVAENPNFRIAVKGISLDNMKEKSKQRLYRVEKDIEAYKASVANLYTSIFSRELGVPFLPFTEDNLKGSIQISIADSFYDLKLPKADFGIYIDLLGYRVVEDIDSNGNKYMIFGAYSNIKTKVVFDESNNLFNCDLSSTVTNTLGIGLDEIDEKDALFRAVRELPFVFAHNIYEPSKDYLKNNISCYDEKPKNALKAFSEMLNKCREFTPKK